METKFIRTCYEPKNRSQKSEFRDGLTRRQVLMGLGSLGLIGPGAFFNSDENPVVVVNLSGFGSNNNPHDFFLRVWEKTLKRLSSKKKLLPASREVLGRENKYSVKIDCRSPASLPNQWLISTLLEMLLAKGVQPWDIKLWDKRSVETLRANLNLNAKGDKFAMGAVEAANFRGRNIKGDYHTGLSYKPLWFDKNAKFPLVKSLSKDSGNIVFTTPKYHRLCGVDGALASTALGSIKNAGRLLNSSDNMIRGICEIWKQFISPAGVLSVVDATSTLYDGGPVGLSYYKHNAARLIIGRDPVAVDSVALNIIDKKRQEVKYASALETGHKLLETAEKMGLGSTRPKIIRINIIE